MSHLVSIKTELRDLDAVKAACAVLGLQFKENQKTIKWYGTNMGDGSKIEGMKNSDYGKCDHAIALTGKAATDNARQWQHNYEIGLLRNPQTGGLRIYFDAWGPGKALANVIGPNGGKLVQEYAAQVAMKAAALKGYTVHRSIAPNGNIKLKVGVPDRQPSYNYQKIGG